MEKQQKKKGRPIKGFTEKISFRTTAENKKNLETVNSKTNLNDFLNEIIELHLNHYYGL